MKPSIVLAALVVPALASADVTRTEVIERAKDYAYYPWRARAANLVAPCHADYESAYVAGDFLGVAYDWGGFDSLFQFSKKLSDGQAAGSPAGGLVTSCTTGVDCSGFVSRTWKTTSKYGTSTLHEISSAIAVGQMLPGDVFNDAGNHVVLYSHTLASGAPYFYEAAFSNVHVNATGGWSWVEGFVPRRYQAITGTTVANPVGTLSNPIVIDHLPYSDTRDTRQAPAAVLDGCAAAPTANETGPEYVYRIEITSPGQLTVAVADDAGVDIDVHLATSWNTNDCVARHDTTFTQAVDCGTYYIIADTYGGVANAGAYDLAVSFAPSGQGCGNGPAGYDFHGGLGEACAFPDHPDLPPCNPTLGGDVCLYTTDAPATSFCSTPCAGDADCAAMPGGGGCCQDIGADEPYCMTADLCPVVPGDGSGSDGSGSDGAGSDGGDPGDPGSPDDPTPGGGCAAGGSASLGLALALVGVLRRRRLTP